MADLDPTQTPLEETFQLRFPKSLVSALSAGALHSALFAGVIFPLFLLIQLGGLLSGMIPIKNLRDLAALLLGCGLFLGSTFAIVGVILFPICLLGNLFKGKRLIQIANGVLKADLGGYRVSAPLTECRWRKRTNTLEGYSFLFQPSVQIMVSERQFVVCGFDADKLRLWSGFLRLAGVPEFSVVEWSRESPAVT